MVDRPSRDKLIEYCIPQFNTTYTEEMQFTDTFQKPRVVEVVDGSSSGSSRGGSGVTVFAQLGGLHNSKSYPLQMEFLKSIAICLSKPPSIIFKTKLHIKEHIPTVIIH